MATFKGSASKLVYIPGRGVLMFDADGLLTTDDAAVISSMSKAVGVVQVYDEPDAEPIAVDGQEPVEDEDVVPVAPALTKRVKVRRH